MYFNQNLRYTIRQRLFADVEGKFAGGHGFIVGITEVPCLGYHLIGRQGGPEPELPPGRIDPQTGLAVFQIEYQAVVYRPFKGEVVDAEVSRVTQHGFFAESGPLTIFVSHHLLPEDMQYKTTGEVCFQSRDQAETIKARTSVRLKIIGLKIETTEITATGSMREDYLGVNE